MTRHTLYLSGNEIALYASRSRSVNLLGRFRLNPVGLEELKQQLVRLGPVPVAILADLIEEEFRKESLPHALGQGRKSLHARQVGKLYRSTPFRRSTVVGRNSDGRRDDRVVFSALTNRDNLEPVLAIIEEQRLPLSGIHSLPVCTEVLLKPLGAKAANVLVVSEQPGGGLRQTLIHKGRVHFSRLAPVSENTPAEYCEVLTAEIDKTQRYLLTLRLFPRDELLEVFALTDADRAEAMDGLCVNSDSIHYHPVILSQVAGRIGYRHFPDTRFGDSLFVYMLHGKRCSNHYARAPHLRGFRTWQLQHATRAAMWLVIVSGLVVSGMNLVDAWLMQRDIATVRQATSVVNARYRQVTRQLPEEFEDARPMREAVHIADRIESGQIDIGEFLSMLGSGFSTQTNLAMEDMKWFSSESPQATPSARQRPGRDQDESLKNNQYVISNIKGHLRAFDGSYSKAHQQIEKLAAWFRQQPGVHDAQVVNKPLNTRTDSELHGVLNKEGRRETAGFELRLVMEVKHGSV